MYMYTCITMKVSAWILESVSILLWMQIEQKNREQHSLWLKRNELQELSLLPLPRESISPRWALLCFLSALRTYNVLKLRILSWRDYGNGTTPFQSGNGATKRNHKSQLLYCASESKEDNAMFTKYLYCVNVLAHSCSSKWSHSFIAAAF